LHQKKDIKDTMESTGLSITGGCFEVKWLVCKIRKIDKMGKLCKIGKIGKRGKKHSCFLPEEGYYRYNGIYGPVKYW
jgi:hypothetical protein